MFSPAAAGHTVGAAATAVGCSPNTSRSITGLVVNQGGTACLSLIAASGNSSRKGSPSFLGGAAAAAVWLSQLSSDAARRGSTIAGCLGRSVTAKLNSPPPARNGKEKAKPGKKEHHLWMKRDSTGSGQKALNLVRIVSQLPNEKEAIDKALDKWTAFEVEFPLIAVAKALGILRRRNQWLRIIQVSKWLLSKGQAMTMGTYDVLLLALDMEGRVDEAETIWHAVLETHTRSISRRLFSRMIAVYDHHRMPAKILEVFADMEELGVKPDEDTVTRVGRALQSLGQEDNRRRLFQKYGRKFGYLHFNGERVRVRISRGLEDQQ
ncbi:unnamed protein product [Spirodela intermedia]|uniref:Uncharacterized protein n=1 Tax=Spirodela intermedia TaxID=51605 RepID=A0A7I8L4T0_SPIIN|nr:unnamed protein product [Spirodela intermedia]